MSSDETRILAIYFKDMHSAVWAINTTRTAHKLRQIVPEQYHGTMLNPRYGYWLIYPADSWIEDQFRTNFPDVSMLNSTR